MSVPQEAGMEDWECQAYVAEVAIAFIQALLTGATHSCFGVTAHA